MRLFGPGGRSPDAGRRPGGAGPVLAAALLFIASGGPFRPQTASTISPAENRLAGRYGISARLILFGNLGEVGSMVIESFSEKSDGLLRKTVRLAGSTYPEQAKKKRDYRGEFVLLKTRPLGAGGSADEGTVESSASGSLSYNTKLRSEKLAFFPGHAVSVREDGKETRIEGSYGSILSPLEYLIEHDIEVGDVVDTPFVLNGVPRLFRMEVTGLANMSAYKAKAYEIVLYAIEKTAGQDKAPKDVWRKKGNVKIWFCKDGPCRNLILRMKIRLRWYLWLNFELEKPAPAQGENAPFVGAARAANRW